MVNEERAVAKVPPVAMDELATRVATIHATEMALHEFASHWGRNGFKPYHRYSFAGGTEATQENVSAADNTWSNKLSDLRQDTSYLHLRLYPGNTAERWSSQDDPCSATHASDLESQSTNCGCDSWSCLSRGISRLRRCRARRNQRPGCFAAKMLKRDHTLNHVEVFYELLPVQPELSWLREPRSHGLPDHLKALRPKVAPPYMYSDRTRGDVDVNPDGSFSVPVTLFHDKPGIYTIVAWLKPGSGKAFPATEVCIRALDR